MSAFERTLNSISYRIVTEPDVVVRSTTGTWYEVLRFQAVADCGFGRAARTYHRPWTRRSNVTLDDDEPTSFLSGRWRLTRGNWGRIRGTTRGGEGGGTRNPGGL